MALVSVQKTEKRKITCSINYSGQPRWLPIACASVPANAAGGCSGPNLTKTESMIEAMADGEGKIMAQKEIALAQDAMLSGKMGACGMHLNKAMHDAGMAK